MLLHLLFLRLRLKLNTLLLQAAVAAETVEAVAAVLADI
jgi:hypothetical protein